MIPCSTRALIPLALLAVTGVTLLSTPPKQDPRLAGGERSAARDGWIQVRLAGTPAEIGFQHGYLLAPEIDDALKVTRLSLLHENPRSYEFYRTAAQRVFWPKVDEEYRQEMTGIVEGLAARGVKADLWDVVILNASLEWGYYTDWLDHSPQSHAPDRCSAFVATGSYTKDGQVVIAHNNWSGLSRRRALEHRLRHPPRRRPPIHDGRLPGHDPLRRRFRPELSRHRDYRNHHHAVPRLRPRRHAGSLSARAKPCSIRPASTTSRA